MEKKTTAEIIKELNERIKLTQNQMDNQNKNRKTITLKPKIASKEFLKEQYPIETYIPPFKRRNHTNFEELLKIFKENYLNNNIIELNDIIFSLEDVYFFYKEKKELLDKDLENVNKLYVYRFKKIKEKMEIFKLFETITDILFYFIEYVKIENPDNSQNEMLNKKISNAKQIIKFKNEEQANMFIRDPQLDNVKLFENLKTEKELNKKSNNNTINKTIDDKFEIQKDCHIIKNDLLDFVPKIELNFDENIEMNEELFKILKSELKDLLEEDNFSIIEMNKGSFHVLISLQFLLNKVYIKGKEAVKNLSTNIEKILSKIGDKIKGALFIGKKMEVKKCDIYVKNIEDCEKEIIQAFSEKCKGIPINEETNFYEIAKSFSINDFNELMYQIQLQNEIQEHDQLLKNYQEYYEIFDTFFDKMLSLSVFEYQLVKIYTLDRDDYQKFKKEKNDCENMKEKLLFHGTTPEYIVSILKTFINIEKNKRCKVGKGFYLSDLLDVSWIYGMKTQKIPNIGDSFSVLVVNTFYSDSQVEYCYEKPKKEKEKVPKNGIRIARSSCPKGKILKKNELENYDKFIRNEYLISDQSQMIPLYAITLRRNEYLIIWRDNNFDKNKENPNNYKNFDKMKNFNEEIQKYAYRFINSKIYYVNTTEEGLKLIDRKKYNKIIIITNGANDGEGFIKESRKILGANSIALVSCYLPRKHLNWITKLTNTFIGNEIDFLKDFIYYSILEKKEKMLELKLRNEQRYNIKFDNFDENELFKFPNYKTKGNYTELTFNPKYNK